MNPTPCQISGHAWVASPTERQLRCFCGARCLRDKGKIVSFDSGDIERQNREAAESRIRGRRIVRERHQEDTRPGVRLRALEDAAAADAELDGNVTSADWRDEVDRRLAANERK